MYVSTVHVILPTHISRWISENINAMGYWIIIHCRAVSVWSVRKMFSVSILVPNMAAGWNFKHLYSAGLVIGKLDLYITKHTQRSVRSYRIMSFVLNKQYLGGNKIKPDFVFPSHSLTNPHTLLTFGHIVRIGIHFASPHCSGREVYVWNLNPQAYLGRVSAHSHLPLLSPHCIEGWRHGR